MLRYIRFISLALLACFLSACAGLFDTDNTPTPTPLTSFTSEAKPRLLFRTKTGSGASDEYLKLTPTITASGIYTTSVNGIVSAINKTTGRTMWSFDTKLPLIAGPGAGNGILVVGSRRGNVVALDQLSGAQLWHTTVQGEIIASPAISERHVIVKSTDGSVHALDTRDGHLLWTFRQAEPNLILRGSSTPRLHGDYAFVGFANGNLAKIGIQHGHAYWSRPISKAEGAFAIQRMIDIDADPVISGHRIYAATYQGHIASLEWESGDFLWSRDISSYTGMSASGEAVYVTDAKSHVWSFGATSGLVNWRQTQLAARVISAPASIGQYIVVGDKEGYLHWLSKRDGHFVAREFVGAAIFATPLVENGIVYIYTNNGNLLAYSLS